MFTAAFVLVTVIINTQVQTTDVVVVEARAQLHAGATQRRIFWDTDVVMCDLRTPCLAITE
jgi:hypothetical protein